MISVKGKSICVFSAKGGVGKSVTAINLAGVFGLQNKKVLIIDFDLTGGAIATYLNTPFERNIYNFVEDYANNRYHSIKEYITRYDDNIDFLAAPRDPRQGTIISASYIEVLMEKAKNDYDIVIVDTNHVLSEFNVTLLDKCDTTLLVVSNDLLDLKNTRNLIHIFKDAEKENYKVLFNNSINPYKKYYSLYDVKNIIKANINYLIDSSFFIKTFDTYVSDGIIITKEKSMPKTHPKVYRAYMAICNDLMELEHE